MARDNHHDSLFRSTFSRPDVAEGYLKAHLPAELVSRCDWSGLVVSSGSFVDPELRDLETDLLYLIPLKGGGPPLLVYVLLEHQHRVDKTMGFRLLRYMVRIWDRHLQEHDSKGLLPAIVPLVLYHGETRWTAKTHFQEMFSEDVRSLLSGYLPAFRYDVQDLARFPDAKIQGEALGKMTLLLLKHGRSRRFWELFPAWVSALSAVAQNPDQGRDALSALLRYVVLVGQSRPPEAILSLLKQTISPQTPEVIMGWAQELHDEGLQKGLEQGRQEGLLRGQRELLCRLLERRFGALPNDARERVTAASTEALAAWGEQLFQAASLEDLLGAE